MEGFLNVCKFIRLKLFKPSELNAEGMPTAAGTEAKESFHQERYELNDFQLLCRNCYKCYSSEHTLKKHVWACLRPYAFKCKVCEKAFKHKNDYEIHERTHTGNKPFKCDLCGKEFSYRSGFQHHKKVFHEKKRYKCDHCDKDFATGAVLKYHKSVAHGYAKPFSCKRCDATFVYKSLLEAHMKKTCRKQHPAIKPRIDRGDATFEEEEDGSFKCPAEGCGKTYKDKGTVKRHFDVNHTKRCYRCPECGKEYTTATMVKYHMAREHDIEKEFSCQVCGEEFVLKSFLNRHFRNKHSGNPYWKKKKET